ncbi:MAG: MmcQ/YjbR family DNA-binding protein, partial [Brevundimonas sp.]
PDELRDWCLEMRGAEETFPFSAGASVFKVGGKIFAILGDDGGLSIKLSEVAYEALTELGVMRRAPYLPRGGWAYTDDVTGWDDQELSDLIARSHELVAAGLTKKARLELGL